MVSKKNIFKIAIGILALSLASLLVPLSSAFGEGGFRAGNIISDANMYQATPSMSQAEIQKFLDTQGRKCSGKGCLKSMRLNTRSFQADSYCKGSYQGANNEPVSQIIYKVSRACQINPKVLLVTIQKEQSGITRSLGTVAQNKLTGYGCPDGKPCNEAYYGVQNQIYQAAHQFQRYRVNPRRYSFRAGISADILFSHRGNCGSSKVTLENQATASLYNYTPYQPTPPQPGTDPTQPENPDPSTEPSQPEKPTPQPTTSTAKPDASPAPGPVRETNTPITGANSGAVLALASLLIIGGAAIYRRRTRG